MIAIVHSIYSQSVHAPARDAGLMDNEAERYCTIQDTHIIYGGNTTRNYIYCNKSITHLGNISVLFVQKTVNCEL